MSPFGGGVLCGVKNFPPCRKSSACRPAYEVHWGDNFFFSEISDAVKVAWKHRNTSLSQWTIRLITNAISYSSTYQCSLQSHRPISTQVSTVLYSLTSNTDEEDHKKLQVLLDAGAVVEASDVELAEYNGLTDVVNAFVKSGQGFGRVWTSSNWKGRG